MRLYKKQRDRIRLLTIINIYSREPWAFMVGHRLRDEDVVTAFNRIIAKRTASKCLFVDNGSQSCGQILDFRAYHYTPRSISAGKGSRGQLLHRNGQRIAA
jgi:transposase InsO family protein